MGRRLLLGRWPGCERLLDLAPKSGYVFEWHGCMGLYDRNYGAVTWTKDRLRLSFTLPNKREGFQGIDEKFIPVAWGDRKYLIPASDIVGFCNEVNAGDEPRKGCTVLSAPRRRREERSKRFSARAAGVQTFPIEIRLRRHRWRRKGHAPSMPREDQGNSCDPELRKEARSSGRNETSGHKARQPRSVRHVQRLRKSDPRPL